MPYEDYDKCSDNDDQNNIYDNAAFISDNDDEEW